MADEKVEVTPAAEEIAPKEGSVAAEVAKVEPVVKKPAAESETVPLSVYLALKDDVKELKKEMKESRGSNKSTVAIDGLKDLAKKYPDVSENFISDILGAATSNAKKEIDEKYAPVIEKQEVERQQATFNKAFDTVFDKAVAENPEFPKNMDKEAIKALALTPAYKNTPVAEIMRKLYGIVEKEGKTTTENDTRGGGGANEEVIDFEKITAAQRAQIMEDPKARKKYFDYLDKTN